MHMTHKGVAHHLLQTGRQTIPRERMAARQTLQHTGAARLSHGGSGAMNHPPFQHKGPHMQSPQPLQDRLAQLRISFCKKLPDRYQGLAQLWDDLSQHESHEALKELHQELHKLAGAGATFGQDQLSAVARRLCDLLQELLQTQRSPSPTQHLLLAQGLKELQPLMHPNPEDT